LGAKNGVKNKNFRPQISDVRRRSRQSDNVRFAP
jgi:hypothetical protein